MVLSIRSQFGTKFLRYPPLFSMADSTLARGGRRMVGVSIPAGYTHGFGPGEQEYANSLDPQVVLAQAQEWLVSPPKAPDFSNHAVTLTATNSFLLCIRTVTCIIKCSRSVAID